MTDICNQILIENAGWKGGWEGGWEGDSKHGVQSPFGGKIRYSMSGVKITYSI